MAFELTNNSRSGLTAPLLATKLNTSTETIHYLYKIYPKIFFYDLSRIKIVPEALPIVKRIQIGLNSNGDIPAIFNALQILNNFERRELEKLLKVNKVLGWYSLGKEIVRSIYSTPDHIINYIATEIHDPQAHQIFDFLWNHKTGIVPFQQIQQNFQDWNYSYENALELLLNRFLLFELFRFNHQNKLVRYIALLAEIRRHREKIREQKEKLKTTITPSKIKVQSVESRGTYFAQKVSKLLALSTISPFQLTQNGQLSRSDELRLQKENFDELEPNIHVCLWIAQKKSWLVQVDNQLKVQNFQDLVHKTSLEIQKDILDGYLQSKENEHALLNPIIIELKTLQPNTWYPLSEFVQKLTAKLSINTTYTLQSTAENQWEYLPEPQSDVSEKKVLHLIETILFWLGIVDLGSAKKQTYFRLSELGEALLVNKTLFDKLNDKLQKKGKIIVQPNFEILVPVNDFEPLQLACIELFTTKKSTGPLSIYQLSKDSFLKALQAGADPQLFIQFLLQHSNPQQLPEIVIHTIQDWFHTIKRVRIRPVILIESDDALTITDILHRKRLSDCVSMVSSQTSLIVTGKLLSEIKSLLEKEGFVIDNNKQ